MVNGSSDPTLAASVTGILFAHHVIDGRQRQAAETFARARSAIFGYPLAVRGDGPQASETRLAKLERRYNEMVAKLSVEQHLAVVDLALDLKPGWLRRALLGLPAAPEDQVERGYLIEGLNALAA